MCFTSDSDVATYAHFLKESAAKYGVDVHGWVFMTNHVHLLVTPRRERSLSRMMQQLGRLYVRRFNDTYSAKWRAVRGSIQVVRGPGFGVPDHLSAIHRAQPGSRRHRHRPGGLSVVQLQCSWFRQRGRVVGHLIPCSSSSAARPGNVRRRIVD
ncbi:MAG: transposase [Gammaproteobacteria bacterium]|nr:transposase [Gammaproteobacteria bacterium]